MKKFALPLVVTFMVMAGCQNPATNPQVSQSQNNTPAVTRTPQATDSPDVIPTTPSTSVTVPKNVYPDWNAKVGEKYGEMTLKKILAKGSGDIFAHFTGNVTLTGTYELFGDKEAFLSGQSCFTISDQKEIAKLPQSRSLYMANPGGDVQGQPVPLERFICFSNLDKAQEILGKGKGKATFTISKLDDIIDFEGEGVSMATLEKVISKTPEATDSSDVIPTTDKKLPANVYPDSDAKLGDIYGEMTLTKIDEKKIYAYFSGSVTLTGSYQYYGKDEAFDLGDRVCMNVGGSEQIQKLPVSRHFSTSEVVEKYFCFENSDLAKKLLGTGKGDATVVINKLQDNIAWDGEVLNYATLEKVISKTPEATDSPDVIPTTD